MGFGEAISSGFGNYATFDGRASRSAYWYWTLFAILVELAALILDALVGSAPAFYALTILALFLPGLAVAVRRLHDVSKSGPNLFWVLVPILGSLYLLYLVVQPGTEGRNEYGEVPA